jgi:hypothetical protein
MEAKYEVFSQENLYYRRPPSIVDLKKDKSVSAFSIGNWYLQPSFRRLQDKLKNLLGEKVCLFTADPKCGEGLLHLTLFECVGFQSYPHAEELVIQAMECMANILAETNVAASVSFRGLVWTPTGLALAGYTDEEDNLIKLRKSLEDALQNHGFPYESHSKKLFEVPLCTWLKQPDALTLLKLEKEVERWSECVFGELRVNRWLVGKGSRRQLQEERDDFFAVPVHLHICHRGNLHGPVKELENNFGVLIQRSLRGMDVEIDVWYHEGSLWLGHDKPEYKITLDWLACCKRRLIHCKDYKTLEFLMLESGKKALDLHLFYHTQEHYAITTKGHIMVCPGQPLLEGSLCMMPEMANYTEEEKLKCFSICSDSKDAVPSHPGH